MKESIKTMYRPQSLEVFHATFTSAGQKNAEVIFEKLHLLRKLKFRIFNSMAVIFYLSFHMLSYSRVIHNLTFYIFRKFKNDFVAKSFKTSFEQKIAL